MDYQQFLESKIAHSRKTGFTVYDDDINPMLFGFQKDVVKWAITGGKRAIFASFGLGKTFMQLEISRIVAAHEMGKSLIICPLGVKQEFRIDAEKLNINIEYVRNDGEIHNSKSDILITNYERVRDGKINPDQFCCVSLDEASILRGYGTKTYQNFLNMFPQTKFKYVATATPSPNKHKELIHYAGFLGVMDTGQALTRFFQRDSTKANNLTIYPHKEKEFWLWMASWAVFLTKPSDLGYSDEGYDLPPLNIHYHKINVDHSDTEYDKNGQGQLFRDAAIGLQDASREKRLTMVDRIKKAAEIIKKKPDSHFLIWHDLEAERHEVRRQIPGTVEVYGSQDLEKREKNIIDFAYGKIQYLATKPVISGSGCNFQRYCSDAVFTGIGYKFNDFIQAVHRIYRFLQDKEVNIHIIYAESEDQILRTLLEKWERHKEMVNNMTEIVKKYGLNQEAMKDTMKRTIGIDRIEVSGEYYTAVNNDCTVEVAKMQSDSIDLIHTSIPFSNHYEYTPSYNDYGHNENDKTFFGQMDFLTPELLRALKPGRVAAVHVKDRVLFGNVTGYGMPSMDTFHMDTTYHFRKHGFIFFGMITIETDVVRENNQTYRLGWTEQCKDGSKMGVGCPEYILLFRKLPSDTGTAYADEPVKKEKRNYTRGQWQIDARAKWNSSGNRFLTPDEISQMDIESINAVYGEFMKDHVYDYGKHVQIANDMDSKGILPASFETLKIPARNENVWHNINRMRTLNSEQSRRNQQMHICPLQFDIVERIINRFSNPGDTILDPFAGIMTVPFMAVKMDRYGYGIELNPEYFRDGLKYLESAEINRNAPTLFDMEKIG